MCVTELSGIPNLITADMIKEGAAVIDVGINRVQDPITGKSRLVGDVDFEGKAGEAEHFCATHRHIALCSNKTYYRQPFAALLCTLCNSCILLQYHTQVQ